MTRNYFNKIQFNTMVVQDWPGFFFYTEHVYIRTTKLLLFFKVGLLSLNTGIFFSHFRDKAMIPGVAYTKK